MGCRLLRIVLICVLISVAAAAGAQTADFVAFQWDSGNVHYGLTEDGRVYAIRITPVQWTSWQHTTLPPQRYIGMGKQDGNLCYISEDGDMYGRHGNYVGTLQVEGILVAASAELGYVVRRDGNIYRWAFGSEQVTLEGNILGGVATKPHSWGAIKSAYGN